LRKCLLVSECVICLYSMILFVYCYPALYYLFRVTYVFLEIFPAYMKRQIKIVPVCMGLEFKQIYCVAHKDKIVYVDVDPHVFDISVRVH